MSLREDALKSLEAHHLTLGDVALADHKAREEHRIYGALERSHYLSVRFSVPIDIATEWIALARKEGQIAR